MEETLLSEKKSSLGLIILSYFIAYFYALILIPVAKEDGLHVFSIGKYRCPWLPLLIVLGGVVFITESLNKDKKPSKESIVWLGCFAICTISLAFSLSSVWESGQVFLFVHIFCVYWVLSRSECLVGGKSGKLLLLDGINGFLALPFMHIFDRLKGIFSAMQEHRNGRKIRKEVWWSAGALVLCVLLFAIAGSLLGSADAAFEKVLDKILSGFSFDFEFDMFFAARLMVSLLVGGWLYGLMHGSSITQRETLDNQKHTFINFLQKLKTIPHTFWTVIIAAFSVMYFAFFLMQGSYLFGAFAGKLPEGFIVSQYAREGFFELCKVITVNFSLLWLVTRMAKEGSENKKGFKISCLVLLAESMLFALIAFSKLAMYIDIFGFTPLRFQSIWLVCVLFAACVCWMISIQSGKETFKIWMYFGAISLSALCITDWV